MLFQARAELGWTSARRSADMGQIVRDEGRCTMFNDFIDATGPQGGGWVKDGNQEMMGGYAVKCWVVLDGHPVPPIWAAGRVRWRAQTGFS
jgi:peptide/nickel transport system substrate-binding protein